MARRIFFPRRRRPIRWFAPMAAAAAALLILSGCFPREIYYSVPESSVFQPGESQYFHAVRFAGRSVELSDVERSRLSQFVYDVRPSPDDVVLVAANGSLSSTRSRIVENALAELGVYGVAMVESAVIDDDVTVSVARSVPMPTVCMPAVAPGFSDVATVPPPGCANAINLARMVANPGDLYVGAAPGSADGNVMVSAVERYRAGQVKAPSAEGTSE